MMPKVVSDKKELIQKFRTEGILEAAGRVIARCGLDKTTMEQVAAEAGISKATIYLYFKNKEALYFNCVIERFDRNLDEMERAVAGIVDPLQKIETLIATHVRSLERDKDFSRVFMTSGKAIFLDRSTEFGQAFAERHERFAGLVAGAISEAMDKGVLRRMDPHKAFSLLFSMVRGAAIGKIINDDPAPLSDDVGVIFDVFYNGTRPGG